MFEHIRYLNNDMIVEIGSFKFHGFYESIFDSSDDFIDYEYELKDELLNKYGVDLDIEVNYYYENYDEYKKVICKEFMKLYVDSVIDCLPYAITDDDSFLFDIIDDENNIVVISPKYYNFETDRCYCDIKTNKETLQLIKDYTLNLDGVNEYIVNHFTSRSGFISFISNDIDYWISLDILDYKQNILVALLDMLLVLSDNDIINKINYEVIENVDKYEYAIPYVWYDRHDYTIDEFEKLFEK